MGTRSVGSLTKFRIFTPNVFNLNMILMLYNLSDLLRYTIIDSIDDETISKRGVRGSKFATALRAGQTLLSTLYMLNTNYI